MDIVKTKQKPRLKRPILLGSTGLSVLTLLIALVLQPQGKNKIERNKLLFGTVQRGDMEVSVDGYGILRSDKQTLLTALTDATVGEVVLRPGAQVEEDSVILHLNNPELLQEVEAARIAVTQEQANLRRLTLSTQREMLNEQATLVELTSNLQGVILRREAEEGLAIKGVIPKITFKTTLLLQDQMKQRVQFQEQRINQLKNVIHETQLIQQEQIKQAETHYLSMQQRADRLTVKAGLRGVLQRLPVELGQGVTAGQELALVGSDKDLKALIRISQSKAEQLQIGQTAQINTRREQVSGVVTRITPEVREGTIEVEIAFSEGVPASARPELNVDALIFTSKLNNTLFIERPMNVQSHSKGELFHLENNSKLADLQEISFGEDSGRFIQILDGAKEHDHFILSDMASFHESKQIHLID